MKRKILFITVIAAMIFIAACGRSGNGEEYEPNENDQTIVQDTTTPARDTDSPALSRIRHATSVEMARHMGLGINLGNTMEACDSGNRIPLRATYVYETMWGQPITTQNILTGMRAAGLTTVRIPVAWTNHIDFENGSTTVAPAILDRVEEIVNYALNEDMIVIINWHWDHGWWSLFGHPEQERRDFAETMFLDVWRQIGEHFQYYDYRVILEPSNEEWGSRFNDRTAFSPTGGTLTQDECYILLTHLTQIWLDLIRSQGGYNPTRFLLAKGFNTDVVMTTDDRFVLAQDHIPNRLLLSVHYYTPWNFCGDQAGVENWGVTAEVEDMNYLLGRLRQFTDAGVGIVMGEWGVLDNDGDDRLKFFQNFLANMDYHGFAPVLWDTGWLFNRRDLTTLANWDQRIQITDPYVINAPEIARLFRQNSRDARDAEGMTTEDIIRNARDTKDWVLRRADARPQIIIEADQAIAWIMFASGDWNTQYSVGDMYRPENITAGLITHDVDVTAGAGTYTVGLDFTGTAGGFADGIAFSALAIINGELLFQGYYIVIREVLINGEPVEWEGLPYTTSDNTRTTRVNLYNGWVADIPDEARVPGGDLTDATPTPFAPHVLTHMDTLFITFDFIPAGG